MRSLRLTGKLEDRARNSLSKFRHPLVFLLALNLLLTTSSANGEDPPPADSGATVQPSPSQTQSPTPTPAADPAEVEPLDTWIQPPPPEPTPVPTVRPTGSEASAGGDDKGSTKKETPQEPFQSVVLTPAQRHRIERVRGLQAEYSAQARDQLRAWYARDPRGESEIRVCSLDLLRYGAQAPAETILRGSERHFLTFRRKKVVEAIISDRCDLVALQGLLGRSIEEALEGANELASALQETDHQRWAAGVGLSRHAFVRSGFLFHRDSIDLSRMQSHLDLELPPFDDRSGGDFPRTPLEAHFVVKGKGEAAPRELVVINFDFRDPLYGEKPLPTQQLVRMSEAVRSLFHDLQQEIDPAAPPIFILCGYRSVGATSLPALILDGRVRLADFTAGQCELKEGDKFECQNPPRNPEQAFAVINRNAVPHRKGKEDPRALLDRIGLYLAEADLQYAKEAVTPQAGYRSGTSVIETKHSSHPLAWVELNW